MTSPDALILPPACIGVLGLGRMGLPMGSRLLAAGYSVSGYDPLPAARADFVAAGGRPAKSADDAAAGAAAVITMLPDGKAVRAALVEGPSPLAPRLGPGSIVIDMSSSAPMGTRALAEELARQHITLIDAPVSGGVRRAVDGSLAIMVGGDAGAIARVRPVLEAMGTSIFATGAIGTGHAMKALNNYVSAAGLAAACEALQVGTTFGLDPNLMTDILNVSSGRNNSTEVKLKPFVIPKSYTSGFSIGLMAKDVGIADDLAGDLGIAAPFSQACLSLWRAAAEALGPQADHTAIDVFCANAPKPHRGKR